jgi:molybdenum cofactor cytidylyltransferase
MGRAKQLLPWGEGTLLEQTLRNVYASRVHKIIVVTGYKAADVAAIARRTGASVVHNPDYEAGEMLSSLQVAVARLPADCQAVLVVLADQPLVETQTLDSLIAVFEQGHSQLIAPTFQGQRGNPVIIGRPYFKELLSLPRGAAPRQLLRRHASELHLVAVDSESVLLDIDHPDDYEEHRPPGSRPD